MHQRSRNEVNWRCVEVDFAGTAMGMRRLHGVGQFAVDLTKPVMSFALLGETASSAGMTILWFAVWLPPGVESRVWNCSHTNAYVGTEMCRSASQRLPPAQRLALLYTSFRVLRWSLQ